MAYYDEKPSTFEAVGDGTLRYRFNIEEEVPEVIEGDEQTEHRSQWRCDEVFVRPPFSANKVLEAVIGAVIPATREQKLINDYNAAKLGLLGGSASSDEAKEKVAAYKEFLNERKRLKTIVDEDCVNYGLN